MAGVQADSFQSAIVKCLMNCGIQHPGLSSKRTVSCSGSESRPLGKPAAPESMALTDWLIDAAVGGEYLRRLKWATCQHSTSLKATGQCREALLVSCEWLIEWLIGGADLNQQFCCPTPEVATEETVVVICLHPEHLPFLWLLLLSPNKSGKRH